MSGLGASAQTNVVLIFVDDLGWADNDLFYSQAFAQQRGDTDAFFETPHLQALAADGRTFTQAYASSPVCSPTRASIMLGQSPATHDITQFIGGPQSPGFTYRGSLPLSSFTIAESLRANGYRTGYAGKWHLGGGSNPLNHGFDENYGGGGQGLPNTWFANSNGGFNWANNLPNDGPAFAGEYLTDRLTRDAVDFIDRAVADGEPFFLDLAHYGVHVPFAAPSELVNKYVTKINSGSYAQFDDLTSSQKTEVAIYAAMTESVDRSLGAVRAALDANGVADDTLVLFHSDNGGLATPDFGNFATDDMNAPLRNGKGTLYEGGIRVPLLAAGPGVVQGVDDTPVISHDLHTTILAATGTGGPGSQPSDGVDLTAALAAGELPDRGDNPVVIHYPHSSNQGGRASTAIVEGDWKLIQNHFHGGIELFNLADDLGETTDLETRNPRTVEYLRVKMHKFLADRTANVPVTNNGTNVPSGFQIDPRDAGEPLALTNGSFEDQPAADGAIGDDTNPQLRNATGWSWVDDVVLETGGVANPVFSNPGQPRFANTDGNGQGFQNGPMEGPQLFDLSSFTDTAGNDVTGQLVGIEQSLGLVNAETDYTVRFVAGASVATAGALDAVVRLLAGDTVIGELNATGPSDGRLFDFQLIVSRAQIAEPLVGQPLTLQLLRGTSGGIVSYDHARVYALSDTVIPEPVTAALLASLLASRRLR